MATKVRSLGGCWTCRLRRKKCDEAQPICDTCGGLGIECLYSTSRPEWMDGAGKQKEKADLVKAQVKRHANGRRDKKRPQGRRGDMGNLAAAGKGATAAPPSTDGLASSLSASTSDGTPHDSGIDSSWMLDLDTSMAGMTPDSSLGMTPLTNPHTAKDTSTLSSSSMVNEFESSFIMVYLDYVFPFLNPFYAPRLLDGGRGWLLVVLMRNKALFHTALSLASYVFSVAFNQSSGAHEICKAHNMEELLKRQELSMKELQVDIRELNRRGVKGYLKENSQVLSSIVQLLLFEVASGNTGNWQMHLDAASALLKQIMEHHGTGEAGLPCWHFLLIQLGNGNTTLGSLTQDTPWTADQAALRFFTASLLFFDVLSATALEQPPRLQKYHQHLLTAHEDTSVNHGPSLLPPHLNMVDFVGLENWILLAIGSIAGLDAWKKEMKRSNSLSMTQLVSRAASIENDLRARMPTLDASPIAAPTSILDTAALDPFTQARPQPAGAVSRIWAQAALTYLAVVVSGWQPSIPEIRDSVALTLDLLRDLPSPACLRTMVWPLCVTGCVAGPEEEERIRTKVASMGPVRTFGTIGEAMAIMEKVWANRAAIAESPDSWDVAACLGSLGHPALLI